MIILLSVYLRMRRRGKTIGFFHPYADDGGGGERVLWCAVQAVHKQWPSYDVVIYTGPPTVAGECGDDFIRRAKSRFNLEIEGKVEFVFLSQRMWVEASRWPRFTLLGQSLGSVVLGLEALLQLNPEYYIDSMGYAFTYPAARWIAGCHVACYTHYPTISTDMIGLVASGASTYNNQGDVAKSGLRTKVKLLYYKLFAWLYSRCGNRAEEVMVNSSWTFGHIDHLWAMKEHTTVVFPPCNTDHLQKIPLGNRSQLVISIAQFRPEKNHSLQLQAMAVLKRRGHAQGITLALIGMSRNEGDAARIEALKKEAKDLGIEDQVEFRINVSFEALCEAFGAAKAGLHTMWNEHFGIGVVELMAAGVVPIAHNSGGPRKDIVKPGETGFLAETADEYADCMYKVLKEMTTDELAEMTCEGRKSTSRFSDKSFRDNFASCLAPMFPVQKSA